ncbi:helix-turn-helix domain-containing protein, partial [Pontixanthobacter sp.]
MTLRETFAANLRRYRKAVGLSQEELAHRAQIDRTYVSSLER